MADASEVSWAPAKTSEVSWALGPNEQLLKLFEKEVLTDVSKDPACTQPNQVRPPRLTQVPKWPE